MRNGSTELRKHAREAITRIESTEADKRHGLEEEQEEPDFPDIGVPLLTLLFLQIWSVLIFHVWKMKFHKQIL